MFYLQHYMNLNFFAWTRKKRTTRGEPSAFFYYIYVCRIYFIE